MKKIISLTLALLMLVGCVGVFASCGKKQEFVAVDASDLLKEDFGIAMKKDCDPALKSAINTVIAEWLANGNMEAYTNYYTALSDFEIGAEGATAPNAGSLKTTWDFGAATQTITVYTESGFAPYEFVSNGAVIGVDIAIMNEVAVRLGKKVEVKDVDFNTITACVESATGDAVGAAGMTITDERKEKVDFSDVYASSTLVIVSAKDKAYSSLAALSGLKIGVQEGTSGDLIATAAASAQGYTYTDEDDKDVVVKIDAGTTVSRMKQYGLVYADLKAGRVDAILMDKLPANALLAAAK